MDREEMNKKTGKIIAKAWSDPDFKAKLLENPADTLHAEGIEIPDGVKVNVVENSKDQLYFVIPQNVNELTDADLDNAVGGTQCLSVSVCIRSYMSMFQ